MEVKPKKPDRRAYTFMVIPHRGKNTYSVNMPALTLKRICAAVVCALLAFGGFQMHQLMLIRQAEAEQAELAHLRAVKDSQDSKIRQLAQLTEQVQQEMSKVTRLEQDVRRSLGTDDQGVSRSGIDRSLPGQGRNIAPPSLDVDRLLLAAAQLKDGAVSKQAVLADLNDRLIERNAIRAATPYGWPAVGELTSRFGGRSSPGGIGSSSHKGNDIAGAYGSDVWATADGVVQIAGWYYGYGLYVLIDHGYGFKTVYGHNSELLVSVGQRVSRGQVIARMGNTGVSTGTHVHYEVQKNGIQVNPANFMQ